MFQAVRHCQLQDLIVIGGSSGIGFAAAKILASLHAQVHILDLNAPSKETPIESLGIEFIRCNVASWTHLQAVFTLIGHVDLVFANAGVSEETDYFRDTYDKEGLLEEPRYAVIDVNYRAVLNVVKLSLSAMRKQGAGGSIVLTTSATAYAPEQSLPVYSATKLAVSIPSTNSSGRILLTKDHAACCSIADIDLSLSGWYAPYVLP